MNFSKLCCSVMLLAGTAAAGFAVDPQVISFADVGNSEVRRPIAISTWPGASRFFVANRDSGTISVVEKASGKVVQDFSCGERLADIVCVAPERVLVLDAGQHQLIDVRLSQEGTSDSMKRISVPSYPEQIVVLPEMEQIWLTSRWSKRVTCFALDNSISAEPQYSMELDYEPGLLTSFSVEDKNLVVVADSFGGNLSVIDASTGRLNSQSLPMHNIRGLTQYGENLIVVGQELSPLARSNFDDVHWGNMISNHLFVVPPSKLLDFSRPLAGRVRQVMLGGPDQAAGDPGCAVELPDGRLAIAIGGIGEVFLFDKNAWLQPKRISVGKRPVDMANDGSRLLVANQMSGSVCVIDAETGEVEQVIEFCHDDSSKLTLEQRGEQLFFDSRLSLEGWMSCHSCHTDGHAVPSLNDNLSDESFGAPKRVLSLFNVADTGPWAWNGKTKSLREQVIRSVESTMQGNALPSDDVDALVAFVKSIEGPDSRETEPNIDLKSDLELGKKLFATKGCVNCHKPPNFTSSGVFHVGIEDERGLKEFNPPSLLAVSTRRSFLHDGRAKSLEEVLLKYNHPQRDDVQLDAAEVRAIVDYLKTL